MIKKILSSLSNVVVAIALVTLAGFTVVSFFNTNKANEKIAALNATIKLHNAQISVWGEEIKQLTAANKSLIEATEKLKSEVKANAKAIKDGVASAATIANNRPPYDEICQPVVDSMQDEIDQWKSNFSLAIKDRYDWQAIADNFSLAYNRQVVITDNLQNTVKLISTDIVNKDEIIRNLKKQVAVGKIQKALLGGGTVAVIVAAIVFGILK